MQNAFDLEKRDESVSRTVVLVDPAGFAGVGEKLRQPVLRVFAQDRIVENLPGTAGHRRPHQRDIGVIGLDVAPENRPRGALQRGGDFPLQLRIELAGVFDQHVAQPGADEIRPVPIGRSHLRDRFLVQPRPDAVGRIVRIGDLAFQHRPDHLCGAFEILRPAVVEQRQRVVDRQPGLVHPASVRNPAVITRPVPDGAEQIAFGVEIRLDSRDHIGKFHKDVPLNYHCKAGDKCK